MSQAYPPDGRTLLYDPPDHRLWPAPGETADDGGRPTRVLDARPEPPPPPDESPAYAVGDQVRPAHGGGPMVVDVVYPAVFSYRYRCVRADAAGNPQHELYRARDLTPAEPPPA